MKVRSVLALGCLAWISGCGQAPRGTAPSALPLTALVADTAAASFRQVTSPRAFRFPQDWGAHPDYRSEWWYFTGNVVGENDEHYGFELTFFRFALEAHPVPRDSSWATNQVWMAHLAVMDVARQTFTSEERLSREALGLAGAESEPFKVWVESWSASRKADSGPIVLEASGDNAGVSLQLVPLKALVAQGDQGMDRKGAAPGNASRYYSLTRISVSGSVRIAGQDHKVTGLAWMDREWGSSTLAADTEGWDWFGLQLTDGRELMFYRLRQRGGTMSRWSSGALIGPRGEKIALGPQDVQLSATGQWQSEASGVRYPMHWRLAVPAAGLALDITPYVEGQELDLSVRYWEGAVTVAGQDSGRPISGSGYVELTGY
jgi:predicted secreted hydrolase